MCHVCLTKKSWVLPFVGHLKLRNEISIRNCVVLFDHIILYERNKDIYLLRKHVKQNMRPLRTLSMLATATDLKCLIQTVYQPSKNGLFVLTNLLVYIYMSVNDFIIWLDFFLFQPCNADFKNCTGSHDGL